MGKVITIDGPAASGKTSVSRELARRLSRTSSEGWKWVSTGAFYRGLAYAARQTNVDLDDENALAKLALHSDLWTVEMAQERTHVFFKGQDVTGKIASEDVGTVASRISHFPKVRASLLDSQRDCSNMPEGLVAEGRDCGTVVFPAAQAKIYLTADQDNRAVRRAKEQGQTPAQIVAAQKVRDKQDLTRQAAPLQVPVDAFVIDTTTLDLDQVVERVAEFVRKRLGSV